jgi:hypothetical protein
MELKLNLKEIVYVGNDGKPIEHKVKVGDVATCYTMDSILLEIKIDTTCDDEIQGVVINADDEKLIGNFLSFNLSKICGIVR